MLNFELQNMQEDFVKITNAVYRLLEALPDQDPLKNKAKEKALAVLEGLVSKKEPQKIVDDIMILESYLEVAKSQGWINAMNVLIIKKEYQQLIYNCQILGNTMQGLISNQIPNSKIQKSEKSETYNTRQGKILEILKSREKGQVSDFIKELPNVTKRTIRRDLDELLKMGKVKRIGEYNQAFYTKSDRT